MNKYKVILNRTGEELTIESEAVAVTNELTFYNPAKETTYRYDGKAVEQTVKQNVASFAHNTWKYFVKL